MRVRSILPGILLLTIALAAVATPARADVAPVVSAPALINTGENEPLVFTVTASDPDGEAIASLSAAPLPFGATFSVNATNTSGTFSWTPSFSQAGSYSVTFAASNALTGTATTTITVGNPDRAPVVLAPLTASGMVGSPISFTVTAVDPDGDALVGFTAGGLPSGATFSANATNTAGTFDWTPSLGQEGTYSVTFTAVNALSGSATTVITVSPDERAPVVTAPPTVSGIENSLLTFTVLAQDPDGDPFLGLTASPMPSGAIFSVNATNTSGTFNWTPGTGQAGSYSVTFTAYNSLVGTATTFITIAPADAYPVVYAPSVLFRPQGCTIEFVVTASAPPGRTIQALTAAPLPAGATFTVNGTNTSGTFHWVPTSAQIGLYSITFTALDSEFASASATTSIQVTSVARGPVVIAPASVPTVAEGSCTSFVVTASDPDGDPINCFTAGAVPVGATFSSNAAHTSATFTWCPPIGSAGSYNVTFTACSDICGGTACTICSSAATAILVTPACSPPVAAAGGPYSGTLSSPIEFDGTGSQDPSGGTLAYAWDFGDGSTGVGAVVSHTYTTLGTYNVTLTVTGSCGSDTDQTTATVSQTCIATAFTTGGNRTLRLDSGKQTWCAWIEPLAECYSNADIDLSSIVLQYSGGAISEIHAVTDKIVNTGDRNANGIEEISACFRKEDLRQLFSALPPGETTVTATIRMGLITGGQVSGDLTIQVFSSGAALAARVTPNPFNPRATLTFRTTREGFARASLFDASGRLVRTLLDERSLAPGRHTATLDGRGDDGQALASGIYLYRVETAEGTASGRVVLLK